MQKISHHVNLRRIFISLLFIYSSTQSAAVLAAPASWQGPYLGVYAGGAFGSAHFSTNVGQITNTSYFSTAPDINAVNDAGTSSNDANGGIVGIQGGHDWVWKHLVYGLVLDYGNLPLSSSDSVKSATYPDSSDQYMENTSMNTNWLFTLRGRVGYQFNTPWPSFIYLTGGPALTQIKVSNNFSDNSSYAGMGSSQSSEDEVGWTVGAGIELASFSHTSVSLEYLYLDVPSVDTVASISNSQGGFGIPVQSLTSPFTTTGSFHANLLKLELNYRFGE